MPLAGFRIAGPSMIRVNRSINETAHRWDQERWTRTRQAVGPAAFARLQEATVAIVGCSRSGTLAATMLAAQGVRRLILIDSDVIESHNLDGMILAAANQIGRPKALTIGRRLVKFLPDLAVTVLARRFGNDEDLRDIDSAELLVTCVDQDEPRLRAARMARQLLVPHLDIATSVTATEDGRRRIFADVRLLFPGAGCVRCVGGLADLEQAESEQQAPVGALPRRSPVDWNEHGRLGSLITVN
ncbi:MAG: ThiF family adenylyltransferase, partial [Planctomycetales bacterium]|nr:ThiF family adenylyltransferase [Planctomycetales bacterium]